MTSFRILRRALVQWSANHDSRLGAALAYYTLFSIAPLLLLAVTLAGSVFGEDAAKGKISEHLREWMTPEAASAIQSLVENAAQPRYTGTWAPYIGFAVLVVGALGVFLNLRGGLCTIWKLEPPHGNSWLGILLDYFLALVMILVVGLLLLASLAVGIVLPLVEQAIEEQFPELPLRWRWVELGVSVAFLTLLFAAVYRTLSGRRIPWGYVWYGSLIAAALFTLGKVALSYYILYVRPESIYGAAGSLVIFLLWVYYSSQILFFGAELVQARRTRHEWLGK